MTTLFKEVGYPLSLLIENIEIGEIGLPEIQRPFVWPNSKVRNESGKEDRCLGARCTLLLCGRDW